MKDILAENVPIIKDGKRYYCVVELLTVKGGQNVIYVDGDGTIVKQEPLHRYKARLNRRKGTQGYTLRSKGGEE